MKKFKEIKNTLKNKKGASIMEFFIITVVALLVGAVIFIVGSNMKGGVESIEERSGDVANTLNDNNMNGFNAFN